MCLHTSRAAHRGDPQARPHPVPPTRRNFSGEWQKPKRTSRPGKRPRTFTLPLTNRFDLLPEPETTDEPPWRVEEEPPAPRKPNHGHRQPRPSQAKKKAASPAEGEHAREIQVQPHGDSYFLPGKVAGKAATFLLESSCTTNLLSCHVFDTLPLRDKKGMRPYEGEHGTLADGSCNPFHGIIKLTGRVRDQSIQETFLVSPLEEDAILDMPFLQRHGCHIDFSKSAMATNVNPFTESVTLPAGAMVGRFHTVNGTDVGPSLGNMTKGPRQSPSGGRGTVPLHVEELYEAACHSCVSNQERQAKKKLLHEYSDTFSSGDHDVGLTRAVRHEIPLAAATVSIWQPTHRLGLEKEKEVSQQILDLLVHGLIEPAHSA